MRQVHCALLMSGLAACASSALLAGHTCRAAAAPAVRHLLFVAVPGIRDETQWGGAGILVFDIDRGYRIVKRIPTFALDPGQKPEAVKGVCASAATGRLYVTTPTKLLCLDLTSDKPLWQRAYPGGCDRLAISPDGRTIFLPSLEGPRWRVLDAATGDVRTTVETGSGSHNTICGPDGAHAYLAGLKSRTLSVADVHTGKIIGTVGPFSDVIRPFTVDGAGQYCFVNVNGLLGFEVGDLRTGKMLARVTVKGYKSGDTKRHGCPSHGVGLTPNEREIWVDDSTNSRIHIFDVTGLPAAEPRQVGSIELRDQPGWITFSLDGRYAWPSTGEVIDTRTRRIVATLEDEEGRPVQSEKVVEVDFAGSRPIAAGDQFGVGRRHSAESMYRGRSTNPGLVTFR